MKERLTSSKPQVSVENLRFSLLGNMSLDGVNPATMETKKTQTLKRFNPTHSEVSNEVLTEFLQHQADLLKILAQAESYNLNKIKMQFFFPLFPPV